MTPQKQKGPTPETARDPKTIAQAAIARGDLTPPHPKPPPRTRGPVTPTQHAAMTAGRKRAHQNRLAERARNAQSHPRHPKFIISPA